MRVDIISLYNSYKNGDIDSLQWDKKTGKKVKKLNAKQAHVDELFKNIKIHDDSGWCDVEKFFQLIGFSKSKINLTKKDWINIQENESSVKIQRLFRKYLFKKKIQSFEKLEESERIAKEHELISDLVEKSQNWAVKLPQVPGVPMQANRIDEKLLIKYLDSKPESERALLAKFLRHEIVKNISFERFISGLKHTLLDFLSFIMSLPADRRKYVIVADEPGKSTNWVISHSSKFLGLHPPVAVVKVQDLEGYLKNNKDVSDVLMIDDACYSGSQMSIKIYLSIEPAIAKRRSETLVHVAIPFMINYGEARIKNRGTSLISIRVADHSLMISVADLEKSFKPVTEADIEKLRVSMRLSDIERLQSRTLTYFEHKLPDSLSTLSNLIEDVVPKTISPYKIEDYNSFVLQLEGGMKEDERIENTIFEGRLIRESGVGFIKAGKGDFIFGFKDAEPGRVKVLRGLREFRIEKLSSLPLLGGDIVVLDNEPIALYLYGLMEPYIKF